MSKRVLSHYRFSSFFALINRTCRSRRKQIKETIQLYKNEGLVSDGCSLCGKENFTLLSQGDRYGFALNKQICNHCGLVQTYPRLSPEFHKSFYTHYYRPLYLKSTVVNYQSVLSEQLEKGKLYLELFKKGGLEEALKNISVIEIGCSSGGTISTLKPFVRSVQGCDLDVHAVNFAKERFDVDVEVNMLPSTLPEGRKLFIMSHVLEHVYNPLDTIKKIRAMMNDGDYFFVAVPGLNKVAEGDYKNDLRRYFHIAHVTDFTASTLRSMSQEAGFDNIFIDEDVHALFIAAKQTAWKRNANDSIDNVLRIEKTYRGVFPHL